MENFSVGRLPGPLGVAGSNEAPFMDEATLAGWETLVDEAILADKVRVEAEAEMMAKNLQRPHHSRLLLLILVICQCVGFIPGVPW